jgi:hypothetical protein
MANVENTIFCDGCGVEITCEPYLVGPQVYCCQDCAEGRPCGCGEHMELEDERRDAYPAAPG